MVTTSQAQVLYIGSAISLVTGIVSYLSLYIAKLPGMSADQLLYNTTIRGLNVILNFGAVIAAEAALRQLDLHNWLTYVGLATAGAVGAHVLYKVTTAPKRAEIKRMQAVQLVQTLPARIPGLNDVKQGVS